MQPPRFKLVVECVCGQRYFRCRVIEATDRTTRSFCECGELLGVSNGAFSFVFEAESKTRQPNGVLSAHC